MDWANVSYYIRVATRKLTNGMERGRRGFGDPQRGRFTGGRGQGRGQGTRTCFNTRQLNVEGWESLEDGEERNKESLENTQDVVPQQSYEEGRVRVSLTSSIHCATVSKAARSRWKSRATD